MSIFSAAVFNQWRAFTQRFFPIAGRGCSLKTSRLGTVISGDAAGDEDHAWKHQCFTQPSADDPKKFEWRARVAPGLVGGRDATIDGVSITDDPAPTLLLDGWRDPLRGASVTGTLDGAIVADGGAGYPPAFARLGVKLPARGGDISRPGALQPPEDPKRTREIRAVDVVLVVPRIGVKQEVTLLNPATVSQALSISTVWLNDYVRSAAAPYELKVFAKFMPAPEPDALERLQGIANEPQTDQIHIATVWVVSPPGAVQEDVPDETWTAFPQHFQFYNLQHASHQLAPSLPPSEPIILNTGLAFGIGDTLFNALLNPVNDLNAQITAYLEGSDYKGEFWSV